MKLIDLNDQKNIQAFIEIDKGWSADKKYYIETNEKQKLLLRTVSLDQLERKQIEFDKMSEVFSQGILMSKPLDLSHDHENVYSLFSWLEGEEARDRLPSFSKTRQYQLGLEAGQVLKKIHSISTPEKIEDWETKFSRKIDRNIGNYQSCPLKYEKGEIILRYIDENRHLIKGRSSVFQHGDYHTGNMIISSNQQVGIIDFNRWDFGDAWEEFNRIDFSAEISPQFAAGQIDGYFDNEPPEVFFKLLSLYICVNLLNALPWALAYSDEEVLVMQKKAVKVLEWFDDMQNVVPNWYRSINT